MTRIAIPMLFVIGLVFLIVGAIDWFKKSPDDDSLEDRLKNGEEAKKRVKDLNKKYNKEKQDNNE